MKIFSLIFFTLFFNIQSFAYEDSDIDGVDDSIDLCPDTSFDKLVDTDGCPEDKTYWGELTLQMGSGISIDEDNKKIQNYSFFGNYAYKKWMFSLSNSQQTTYDSNNTRSMNGGDLYLTLGYQFNYDKFQNSVSFGTKISTADESVGTGESDYFSLIDIGYLIDKKLMIFSQIGYTLTGDSPTTNYENSFSYSLGTGYMFDSNWYSSFSYDYAKSIYNHTPNYQSLSWLNSYSFLENSFISLNYSYGLDDLSYPHTFSLKLGATFE